MSDRRIHLVRGLPGSGRTTLARRIARSKAEVIASEDELPYPVSPVTPIGMAQADALSVAAAANALSNGVPLIVVERVFHQAYTMRPFARLAKRHGYDVEIHVPDTDWAHDYEACLQHTRRAVERTDMERFWRHWELVGTIDELLESQSPGERLLEAKRLLAETHYLMAAARGQSKAYQEKLALMTEDYEAEFAHLIYLGYFDGAYRHRVNQEFAHLLARTRIEAQHGPDSPAALRVVQQEILRPLEAS